MTALLAVIAVLLLLSNIFTLLVVALAIFYGRVFFKRLSALLESVKLDADMYSSVPKMFQALEILINRTASEQSKQFRNGTNAYHVNYIFEETRESNPKVVEKSVIMLTRSTGFIPTEITSILKRMHECNNVSIRTWVQLSESEFAEELRVNNEIQSNPFLYH